MATVNPSQNILSPSGIAQAIRFMRGTGISLYVHGAPGISKSAVALQEADRFGIAFIDFRLTTVAPEDVRGVPMMDDAGGMRGLVWTPPLVFPRDLDLAGVVDVQGSQSIKFYNPVGNNGIFYCKKPAITVQALDTGLTAEIVKQTLDAFVVVLKNAAGDLVSGKVLWTVTGKSEAVLGLEEFNSAVPAVMAAAYQLILDRRIGDYVVPQGVMIIAMGNRDGDKGVTFKIPKPVANRFVHLEMKHNFLDWQTWAIEKNIHSDVVGFLSKWESHLFDENFASKPTHAFNTPRSWEFVSKIINQETLPSKEILRALICGTLGDGVGTEFMSHREYMEDMPNVQDIFSGRVTAFNPKHSQYKIQIAYSTCVQMCYALKNESDAVDAKYGGIEHHRLEIDKSPERAALVEKMDKAINYAKSNFPPEVLVVFNRMALQIYKLRFSSKSMAAFIDFAKTNRNMLLT